MQCWGIRQLAWSKDGFRVLCDTPDNGIFVRDEKGAAVATLKGLGGNLQSARFLDDAARVITGAGYARISIWDVATGERTFILEDSLLSPFVYEVSPDGRRLLTEIDGRARFWNLATGAPLGQVALQSRLNHLAFSPDGAHVAVDTSDPRNDNDVLVVPVFRTPQDLVDAARKAMPRTLSDDQRRLFFLD
jgi:WD40 repeat protein